jgi:hypothetical protein
MQSAQSFDVGGVVPGPKGAPRAAIVHGGETIRTPEQEASLGGGPIIIHHQTILDGRVIDERIDKVGKAKLRSGAWPIAARGVVSRSV